MTAGKTTVCGCENIQDFDTRGLHDGMKYEKWLIIPPEKGMMP